MPGAMFCELAVPTLPQHTLNAGRPIQAGPEMLTNGEAMEELGAHGGCSNRGVGVLTR